MKGPPLPLVVMYHYVWPDGQPVPGGIRPLFASEFERQLDWLGANFRIVQPDAFLHAVRFNDFGDKPPCLLTFDDGTRDHAEVVTPILSGRKLGGVFFVLTWPTELKRMPLTHAVHWLLSQGDELVWSAFERAAIDEMGGTSALGDPNEAARIYHYESSLRARIKYAANMALPADIAHRVVERSIAAAGASMEALAEKWFASAAQIRQMHEAGMTIALHGCSHRSLQTLGAAGIRDEIRNSSQYVASITGARPTWFACPFGGSGADEPSIVAMCQAMDDYGIAGSVTTRKALVPSGCNARELPRYDTIDLPPRKEVLWE